MTASKTAALVSRRGALAGLGAGGLGVALAAAVRPMAADSSAIDDAFRFRPDSATNTRSRQRPRS